MKDKAGSPIWLISQKFTVLQISGKNSSLHCSLEASPLLRTNLNRVCASVFYVKRWLLHSSNVRKGVLVPWCCKIGRWVPSFTLVTLHHRSCVQTSFHSLSPKDFSCLSLSMCWHPFTGRVLILFFHSLCPPDQVLDPVMSPLWSLDILPFWPLQAIGSSTWTWVLINLLLLLLAFDLEESLSQLSLPTVNKSGQNLSSLRKP